MVLIAVTLAGALFVRNKFMAADALNVDPHGQWNEPEWTDMPEILSPLFCGLTVLAVFLSALTLSRFYDPNVSGAAFQFMAHPDVAGGAVAADQGARGLWGVTVGLLVLAEIATLWTITGLWQQCARRWRLRIACACICIASGVIALLGAWAWLTSQREFGSKLVGDLVCFTAHRSGFHNLGPITDALNVIGIVTPLLVAFGFCLTLVPQKVYALGPCFLDTGLQWHARQQRGLERILYVGAAVLVAGLVELVTLVAWSYAPFQGTAELKSHVDICRSLGIGAARPIDGVLGSAFCGEMPNIVQTAYRVDEARRFAQSIALMYGATFSALLMSLYVPAALVLQKRLRLVVEMHVSLVQPDQLAAKLARFDVDRTPIKKGITVAVSLGPMIAGVMSSLLRI